MKKTCGNSRIPTQKAKISAKIPKKGAKMTRLMITADNATLEQIVTIAQNIAHRDNKEIRINRFNDERYKSYKTDVEAIKKGELSSKSLDEMLEEIEKWY